MNVALNPKSLESKEAQKVEVQKVYDEYNPLFERIAETRQGLQEKYDRIETLLKELLTEFRELKEFRKENLQAERAFYEFIKAQV